MRATSRVLGLALPLIVGLGSLVAAPAQAADTVYLHPTVACVAEQSPTTFAARLGYVNDLDNSVTYPVGATNYFAKVSGPDVPFSSIQGQPTTFLPGSHPAAFVVTQPKDIAYLWHLLGEEIAVSWSSAPRCADSEESVTRDPELLGVPAVGETVTAAGEQAILNAGTHTESVEWFRGCDTAEPVSVGTGRSYLVGPDAVGQRIQAVIDYRDPVTDVGVTWNTPCDAAALVGEKPVVTTTPVLTGTAVTGSPLSLVTPTVSGTAPLTTTHTWESCDAAGCSAVGDDPTYTPGASDIGHTIRAVVAATNAWGTATRTSASSAAVTAALTGATGVGPATLAFEAPAGTTSAAQTVTFTNGTNAERRIGAVMLTGSGFRRSGGDCYARVVLAPGESCTVAVAFEPATDGPAGGQLTIDDGAPHAVVLSGTASRGGRLAVSASSVSFGKVRVHRKATRSLRVSNTGTQTFSIGSLALSGAHRRDFAVTGKGCAKAVLAPGASCVVTLVLKPRAAGARRAVLTIGSTAAGPARSVALKGRAR